MRDLLVVTALILAAPALAQGAPAAKPKVADGDKLICHREEVTGSLAGARRTCRTRAQWEAEARASQAIAERMADQGRITSCGATTPGGC